MKENIPEGTRAVIESNVFALNGGSMARSKCINNICWHIESLLEEQRKELITQLPDDLKTFVRMSIDNNWQFTEEQVIKAEIAWNKLMEKKLEEQRKEMMATIGIEIDKGNEGKVTYITENSIKKDLINQILSEAPEWNFAEHSRVMSFLKQWE